MKELRLRSEVDCYAEMALYQKEGLILHDFPSSWNWSPSCIVLLTAKPAVSKYFWLNHSGHAVKQSYAWSRDSHI